MHSLFDASTQFLPEALPMHALATKPKKRLRTRDRKTSPFMSYDEASFRIDRELNSFTRMGVVLDYFPAWAASRRKLTYSDWLRLLGDNWISCDRISEYTKLLHNVLPNGPIRLMMTPDENLAYDALPPMVRIYRGADAELEPGPCWSLSKDVAQRFPLSSGFAAEKPALFYAYARKSLILAVKETAAKCCMIAIIASLCFLVETIGILALQRKRLGL